MVRCNFCNQECKNEHGLQWTRCKNEQKFTDPKSLQILLENAERAKSVCESELTKLKSENDHLKLLINNNVTKSVCNMCSNRFIFRYLKLM